MIKLVTLSTIYSSIVIIQFYIIGEVGCELLADELDYTEMATSANQDKKTPFLIYQLGTNNWQREGEFAPGQ